MKRILSYTPLLLFFAALVSACAAEAVDAPVSRPGEGAATIRFDVPSTRAVDESIYPWTDCMIRIFKYTDKDAGERELIRRYSSVSEMPQAIWLVEGDYAVTVTLGTRAEATFDEPSYYGESDFRIVSGVNLSVQVTCRMVNTAVEVVYDESLDEHFKPGYRTIAAIDHDFRTEQELTDNGILHLRYDTSARGYFILPSYDDGSVPTLHYCFRAEFNDGSDMHPEHFVKELSTTPGMLYTITFRYSPDLPGHIAADFEVTVDTTPDIEFDDWPFTPEPQINGNGIEMEGARYLSEALSYNINSITGKLARVVIEVEGHTFEVDCTSNVAENEYGISLSKSDELHGLLALNPKFFEIFAGGDHSLSITVWDDGGNYGQKDAVITTQGPVLLESTDRWETRARLTAIVFDDAEASDVKIGWREAGSGDWTDVEASSDGGELWSAEVTGIDAAREYEYRLVLDSKQVNASRKDTTDDGPQIYNSSFEIWSGSSPLLPYTDESDQWWDTGNWGSSTLNKNVTTYTSDSHSGRAALLQSQYVALAGIGKFAAGNIFIGKYVGTSGTNGLIGFGKEFPYTWKPKKIRFWFKGNVGSINQGSGAPNVSRGDSDVAQFYMLMCSNITGPHIVDTRKTDTFMPLDDIKNGTPEISYCTKVDGVNSVNDMTDGHVVAYVMWENTVSQPEWTMVELDITYVDKYAGEKPVYLMLTASASKYGDYFMGSTDSVMYLDDIEFVY